MSSPQTADVLISSPIPRPKIRGVLPIAVAVKELALRGIVLPSENVQEAAVVSGIEIRGASSLREVIRFLDGHPGLPVAKPDFRSPSLDTDDRVEDLVDVRRMQVASCQLPVVRASSIIAPAARRYVVAPTARLCPSAADW